MLVIPHANSRVLLVAPAGPAAESLKLELAANGAHVEVVAPEVAASLTAFEAYTGAYALLPAPLTHDNGLPAVLKSLTKGGVLAQLLPADADTSAAQLELTLSGFVSPSVGAPRELGSAGSVLEVTGSKPTFATGTATKVVLKKKTVGDASNQPAAASNKSWLAGVVTSTAGTAGGDLIDEDALLAADSLPLTKPSDGDAGCATKRRACKDCSCGRKEAEDAADVAAQASDFKSSCGNCWKGDAFRCGGCPFLGKPSFKPGTDGAVMLDTTDDI